jgi:hypothetical protein
MAVVSQGSIPTNMRIYSKQTELWKLDEMYDTRGWWRSSQKVVGDKPVILEVVGRKGFAVNRDSAGFNKTAERWSTAKTWGYIELKPISRLELLLSQDEEVGEIYEDRPNDPMTGLQLITLEIRGEGGRAWKVKASDGYVYDLREDALLEAMMTVGVQPGGLVNGDWVWCVQGSQMRLVRVGSATHASLTETTEKKSLKPIPAKQLIQYHIYERPAGQQDLYLGILRQGGKNFQVWYEGLAVYHHDDLKMALCGDGTYIDRYSNGNTRHLITGYSIGIKSSHPCVEDKGLYEGVTISNEVMARTYAENIAATTITQIQSYIENYRTFDTHHQNRWYYGPEADRPTKARYRVLGETARSETISKIETGLLNGIPLSNPALVERINHAFNNVGW